MPLPYLIYVQSCPTCGDGLCRIRVCTRGDRLSGCVVCDECESVWTDPSLREKFTEGLEANSACCPDCMHCLWEDQCHWADIQEVCLLGWYDKVKIART